MSIDEQAAAAARKPEWKMTPNARLKRIAEIIELVDQRCLICDGPVGKTRNEMTDKELRRIYRLALWKADQMNIEATAKQIMSARQSDAFSQEACEKILRDNLLSGMTGTSEATREHDAEILREVVRLLASIFLENGKSLLGGSPPTQWTTRAIAQVAAENIKRNDTEVRKPLVDLLRSVHTWFMQQAPQHYNGCGLWIDVDETLTEYPRENCILDVDSPTLPPARDEYLQCGCANCREALAKVKETK